MHVVDLSYKHILKKISFELPSSRITCLIGENGSGKTTLIKCISGYYNSNIQGSVVVNNQNTNSFSSFQWYQTRSVLTQKNEIYTSITCKDYLQLSINEKLSKTNFQQTLFEISNQLQVNHLLEKDYLQCSGGEQQRVNLVRVFLQAILNKTDAYYYIILDEPFNFLDIKYIPIIVKYIENLKNQGFIFLISLHDINLAYQICDSILMISEGELITQGSKENFSTKNLERTFGIPFSAAEINGKKLFTITN